MQYIQFSSFAVALLTGSALALPSSDNPKRDAAASSYSAAAYVTPTATYQYHYTSTPTPNYSAPSDGSEDSDVYVPETMIEEALVDYICSAIEYYSEEGESDSDSPYSPSNSTSYSDNSESSEDYSEDTTSYSDIVQSPLEEVLVEILCSSYFESSSYGDDSSDSLRRRSSRTRLAPKHKRAAKSMVKSKVARSARSAKPVHRSFQGRRSVKE